MLLLVHAPRQLASGAKGHQLQVVLGVDEELWRALGPVMTLLAKYGVDILRLAGRFLVLVAHACELLLRLGSLRAVWRQFGNVEDFGVVGSVGGVVLPGVEDS